MVPTDGEGALPIRRDRRQPVAALVADVELAVESLAVDEHLHCDVLEPVA